MRIQRIIDACALMATKDQGGTLEKLTQLHVEVKKDPAGWLCDWWQCWDIDGVYQVVPAGPYWRLGRMLIRIAGDRIAQLQTDLELYKRELEIELDTD